MTLAEIEATCDRAEGDEFVYLDKIDGEFVVSTTMMTPYAARVRIRPRTRSIDVFAVQRLCAALRLAIDYANGDAACEGWSAFDLEINIARILRDEIPKEP